MQNGTPQPTTDQLRDEYRRERLTARLAEAKLQRRLLESSYPMSATEPGWGGYVDPLDRYRQGDEFWAPIQQDRTDGRQADPVAKNEGELRLIRNSARLIAEINPLAIGALETLSSFVIGENGMTFRATSKDQANQELVADVQDVIDDYLELNDFIEVQQEHFVRSRRDGDALLRHFADGDRLHTRTVEPEQLTAEGSPGGPDWEFGILTDEDDGQTPAEYNLRYTPEDEAEQVPASEILHSKCNVDRIIKRGIPDFFATGDALEGIRKLLRNMREGSAIQAAIVGLRQHESASKDAVSNLQAEVKARQLPARIDPATGKTVNYQQYRPGTVLDAPKGMVYAQLPWMQSGAPNFVLAAQASLRAIGIRWGMPEYMISGDASNNNFASVLVAGSPFTRRVRYWQGYYKRRFLRCIMAAIRLAIQAGRLPVETLRLVTVQAEAPAPELANELEQGQVDQLDMQAGVLSKQTRRQRRGLDDEQERVNLAKEPVQQQPGPGGFPGGAFGESFFPRARRVVFEGSYLANCPRNNEGHCKRKGSGDETGQGKDKSTEKSGGAKPDEGPFARAQRKAAELRKQQGDRKDPPAVAMKRPSQAAPKTKDAAGKSPRGQQREALATSRITNSTFLGGGANESRKVHMGGSKAVFKPADGEDETLRQCVKGNYYKREVASSEIADLLGLDDLVPLAVERKGHDGKVGSAMHWVEGASDAAGLTLAQKYDGPADLQRAAAFDFLTLNTDRHDGNWMVKADGKIQLIDNGMAFPDTHEQNEYGNSFLLATAIEEDMPIPPAAKQWTKNQAEIDAVLARASLSETERALTRERVRLLADRDIHTFKQLWESSGIRTIEGIKQQSRS